MQANLTYTQTVTMVTEICCNCGVCFGIPSDLKEVLLADNKKSFYCPNGHGQHYSVTTESKLRTQLENERALHRQKEFDLLNDCLREKTEKKNLQRKFNRLTKGVCPCCNRSFLNLQRHIKTKHPEITTP